MISVWNDTHRREGSYFLLVSIADLAHGWCVSGHIMEEVKKVVRITAMEWRHRGILVDVCIEKLYTHIDVYLN